VDWRKDGPQDATACYVKSRAFFLSMGADAVANWLHDDGSRGVYWPYSRFSEESKANKVNGLMMSVLTVSMLQEQFANMSDTEAEYLHCWMQVHLGLMISCDGWVETKMQARRAHSWGKQKYEDIKTAVKTKARKAWQRVKGWWTKHFSSPSTTPDSPSALLESPGEPSPDGAVVSSDKNDPVKSRAAAAVDFVKSYQGHVLEAVFVGMSVDDIVAQADCIADVSSLASSISYLMERATAIRTCRDLMSLLTEEHKLPAT